MNEEHFRVLCDWEDTTAIQPLCGDWQGYKLWWCGLFKCI